MFSSSSRNHPAAGPVLRRYLGTDGLHLLGAACCLADPGRKLTVALLDANHRIVAMGRADQSPPPREGIPDGCGFSIPIPLAWLRHPEPEIRFRFRILENGIEFPEGGRSLPRRKLGGGTRADGVSLFFQVDEAMLPLRQLVDLAAGLNSPYLLGVHELQRSGAPLIALSLARELARSRGWQPITLCLGQTSPLIADFQALGPVVCNLGALLVHQPGETRDVLAALRPTVQPAGLVNSLCSAELADVLAAAGYDVISLVHEFPFAFTPAQIARMLGASKQVIFPCQEVLEHFTPYRSDATRHVAPQGAYQLETRDAARTGTGAMAPEDHRQALGLPADAHVVLGCGTVDARKGFDWFISFILHFARHSSLGRQTHFVWLGKVHDHDMFFHGVHGLQAAGLDHLFHHLGEQSDPTPVYEAADLLLMCSRIDPFPSVVLEAIGSGIPVVGFDRGQGTSAMLRETGLGKVVRSLDMEQCRLAIEETLTSPSWRESVAKRGPAFVRESFRTDRYADTIAAGIAGGPVAPTPPSIAWQGTGPDDHDWQVLVRRAVGMLQAALPSSPRSWTFPWGELRFLAPSTVIPQIQDILLAGRYRFLDDKPAPRIIDGGGNVGIASLAFRRDHPSARITLFEPDPELAALCAENLAAAGIHDIEIRAEALWDTTGDLKFSGTGDDRGRLDEDGTRVVKSADIAEVVAGGVDLLKLDIEGAELACLERLITTGAIRQVRNLVAELHLNRENAPRMMGILHQLGQAGFNFAFSSSMEDWLGPESSPAPFPLVDRKKTFLNFHAWQSAGRASAADTAIHPAPPP